MHNGVSVGDTADDTLPGKNPASVGRCWLRVIGFLTVKAYWAAGPHRASEARHKLNSAGRLLLIMWACVSPCWCGCCNLPLPWRAICRVRAWWHIAVPFFASTTLCVKRRGQGVAWEDKCAVVCLLTKCISICLAMWRKLLVSPMPPHSQPSFPWFMSKDPHSWSALWSLTSQ